MFKKAIVTYSFCDDQLRDSFEALLQQWGLVNEPDQTTYALPHTASFGAVVLHKRLAQQLDELEFEDGEHVTLYVPVTLINGTPSLKTYSWSN